MKKNRKILSYAVPILCIVTSILVMLYLFHYIGNVWVVFVMSTITFVVSGLNFLMIIKDRKKQQL